MNEIICIRKGTPKTVFDQYNSRFDAAEILLSPEDNLNDLNILAIYTIEKKRRYIWNLRYHLFDVKNDAEAARALVRHIEQILSGI